MTSLKRHFDDDLSCPVCLENFVGEHLPKDLDCPHVCCQICLNKIPTDIIGGIRCPQCLRITVIPTGGVPALRTNLRVRSLAEKLNDHKRANLGKTCIDHDDQEVLFFCKTCSTPICQYCIISEHCQHTYEPVKSIVALQKQKLERVLQRVEAQIKKCEENDSKLTENEKLLATKFKLVESSIDQCIQECLEEVKKQGSEMKAELQLMKNVKLDSVQKQTKSNWECMRHKRDVIIQVKTTCDKVPDTEYMGHHQKWFSNLKTLIEDGWPSANNVEAVTSGFRLEVRPQKVTLGLKLLPEYSLGDSDHDVPSTSSIPHEEADQLVYPKHFPESGKQKPTSSTQKNEDDDHDVLIVVSDSELEDDDKEDDDNIFDLTEMVAL